MFVDIRNFGISLKLLRVKTSKLREGRLSIAKRDTSYVFFIIIMEPTKSKERTQEAVPLRVMHPSVDYCSHSQEASSVEGSVERSSLGSRRLRKEVLISNIQEENPSDAVNEEELKPYELNKNVYHEKLHNGEGIALLTVLIRFTG
jgi:hypothetical protein